MNRNGTAILATAILFSMLASSGTRPATSPRSGTSGVPPQRLTSPTNPAHTNCEAPDCKDPKHAGKEAYQGEITYLFKQYCQDGTGPKDCRLQPDNFVIAIVPDPVHTHLALYFDRTIDTIQEALQDDGYIFYRAIVPWDQDAHPQPDDYKLRLAAKLYQDGREQLPGIMLFSASRDVDADALKNPLAVMLVGESPTGGVNKGQFQNAIEQIHTLTEKQASEIKLRILGPTFSGSLYSLKNLLTCGKNVLCFSSATILSGSITGREAVDDFRDAVSDFQKEETGPAKPIETTTFDTLQETDDVMLERFIEFIAGKSYGERNYDVRHVAELSEDESAYGSLTHSGHLTTFRPESGYCKFSAAESNNTAQSQNAPQPPNATPSQNTGPSQSAARSDPAAQSCSILRMYFPREISQLRAAYQDNSGSANSTERFPFLTLPHNFGVSGAEDDTVATFSQKQTPLSQEAVLLSIVAELRKHAIEFVVLNATDPMDTLFLSHYLRSAYPQGRIVTMGADMLFPREVEDTTLHGILALSTYSVSPSANHQFYQFLQSGTERLFPSSFEIGTYNALHSLITAKVFPSPGPLYCDPDVSKNECADQLRSILHDRPLYLIQYGWRERGEVKNGEPRNKFSKYNAPPVRVSALGNDGYWPVANLGPFEYPCGAKEKIHTLLPQVVGDPQQQKIMTQSSPLVRDPQQEKICPQPSDAVPAPKDPGPPPVDQFTTLPAPVEVPGSWAVVEVLGVALACGFCVSLWFASIRSHWQPLTQFAPTTVGARVWLIAACGFFLISASVILLWPFVHGSLREDWRMAYARQSIGSLAMVALAILVVTALDLLQRQGSFDAATQPTGATWSSLWNLAPVLVFIGASVFFAFYALKLDNPNNTVLNKPFDTNVREHLAGIRHFETLRAIQLTSGLSPVLPILFLLAAGLWWANHTARGWTLLDERRPRLPSGVPQLRIGEDGEIVQELLPTLRPGFSSITHYLVLSGIGLGMCLLLGGFPPFRMLEPFRLEVAFNLSLSIAWAGLVGTTLRLWNIWFRTRQLLLSLDSLPLRRAFCRLEGFSWKPIWKFGEGGVLDEYQRILAREREALQTAANVLPELKNSKQKIDMALKETRSAYESAKDCAYPSPFAKLEGTAERTTNAYVQSLFSLREWAASRKAEQKVIRQFGCFQDGVALAARDALNYLAEKCWPHETEEPKRRAGQETADELKTRACERFVSLVYVSFLMVVLARLRTLILAIGGMYILIVLAMTLYPFEPKPAVQAFLAVSLFFIVAVVGLVFAQIHRDATLSHITDTKPGELGGDFYLRMASFIALPLFTFFAIQFPEIGRTFYSWMEPALQALNR
jgi:hypothetical protein